MPERFAWIRPETSLKHGQTKAPWQGFLTIWRTPFLHQVLFTLATVFFGIWWANPKLSFLLWQWCRMSSLSPSQGTSFLFFCQFLIAVALEVPLWLGHVKVGGLGGIVTSLLITLTTSFFKTQHVHTGDNPFPVGMSAVFIMESAPRLLSLSQVSGEIDNSSLVYCVKFSMQLEQVTLKQLLHVT